MNEISKVLNQDEQVLWQDQPQFSPYIFSSLGAVIFGLIWTAGSSVFLFALLKSPGVPWFAWGMVILFIAIGLYLLVGTPLYMALAYKNIWYVITDKRVILQNGLIARNFDVVDYDKVESADMNVGLIDKMLGKNSGSIAIYANRIVSGTTTDSQGRTSSYTRNVPFVLSHITDPYTVFDLFKKTSFDVKADINYPNALRPKEDTGYQTEYKPEDNQPPQR